MATDDPPENLTPDPDPPPRATRSDRRRPHRDPDDRDDDEEDDRDARYHPRGRNVRYDEDGFEITSDDSMWALFAHVGVFVVGFIAPLVILIVFSKKSPFVVRHAKESLNHQITLVLLSFLVIAVAAAIGFGVYAAAQDVAAGVIVGYVLALVGTILLSVLNIVLLILATIAASKYRYYRYPFTIRLIG